jgi:copper chaperone CopZ
MILCLALLATVGAITAQETKEEPKPEKLTLSVRGLFAPDREEDLKEVFEELPEIKLLSVDYEKAQMTIEFTAKKAFPGAKPAQVVEQMDQKLRNASHHTFSVRPRSTTPREKLKWVVIPAKGLDCKGCCLAAYEAIATIEGVERATASFREGKITALIDPGKVDQAKLEEALRKKGVSLDPLAKK